MRTKWFLMPLVIMGLSGWTYAQAIADQGEREIEVESERQIERNGSEVQVEREFEAEDGQMRMEQEVEGDTSELRRWAEQEPISPRQRRQQDLQRQELQRQDMQRQELRGTATRPAELEAERPREPRAEREIRQETDVYIFEDRDRTQRPQREARMPREEELFSFRDRPSDVDRGQLEQETRDFRAFREDMRFRGGTYGYADESQMMGPAGAPPAGGAVGQPAIRPTLEDADHSWRRARNLVDDNYIQTRDTFEVDRDFYTKEWKVSAPPLVPRPRFHTIYDSDFTQQYYTSWHGSPVVWAPNRMTPTPLPQTRNQMFTSSSQLVTFWKGWQDDENISNVPQPFASTAMTGSFDPYRGGAMPSDLYGYREGTASDPHTGMTTIDGSIRHGRSVLYWDDQDLFSGGAGPAGLAGTTGWQTYGYVSPEAGRSLVTPVPADGDVHQNVPIPRDLNIYGVPAEGAQGQVYGYRDQGYTTYGYVETEPERRERVKVKTYDKDCPDDHREARWDEVDRY